MQTGETPKTTDYFSNLNAPNPADQQIQLQQLVQQGSISPEQAQAIMQDPSAMNNITTDPSLMKNQMAALQGLQDVSDNGGMTDTDKANLSNIQNQANTAARGQREAIMQNAQARGLGGSGLDLMNQMVNQQDSATRASQQDMDVAGQARDRALQALMQQGQLSGQMQNTAFNQQAQVAGANDAISRFNAQNQQNVQNQNVAANNAAQQTNLGLKQNIADANTATANQQEQYNKGLIQQNYQNELQKRGGEQGVATQQANAAGANSAAQANANNQTIGMGLSVVSPLAGAGYTAASQKQKQQQPQQGMKYGGIVGGDPTSFDSQSRMLQPGEMVIKKEDVPNMLQKAHTDDKGKFDAAGFLDSITGHKYGYSKGKR